MSMPGAPPHRTVRAPRPPRGPRLPACPRRARRAGPRARDLHRRTPQPVRDRAERALGVDSPRGRALDGDRRQRATRERQCVCRAVPHSGCRERPRREAFAGVRDRNEVGGEVAAVHRRDVARLERPQVLGRIPVVEVTATAFEPLHRAERRFQALDQLQRTDPAEVPRADGRQQVEAEIGRRSPARDHRRGVLLEVVRRQPVVGRRDERVEVAPCAPCDEPQGQRVGRRHRDPPRDGRRAADDAREQRREHPQQRERRDRRREHAVGDRQVEQHRGDRHRRRHPAVEADGVELRPAAGLRRGHPLEQVAARDVEPHERAGERIRRQHRLVEQEREQQSGSRQRVPRVGADRAQVVRQRGAGTAWHESGQHRRQHRRGQYRDEARDPERRDRRRQRRPEQQRQHGSWRHERPSQVVDHLPAAEQRDPPAGAVAGHGTATEYVRQQLPVAARPAVRPRGGDVVARGVLLDDLDVGHEARPREHALEQVVAQQYVLGHASIERGRERVDVVDALADVGAFTAQVLVDVGHRCRVRVDAARVREDPLVRRAFGTARQRRRDPRLQDRVTLDDATGIGVESGSIQRVRELPDQPPHGVAGQPRVGVERDDEPHVRRHVGAAVPR
jgi:hypothetical protein